MEFRNTNAKNAGIDFEISEEKHLSPIGFPKPITNILLGSKHFGNSQKRMVETEKRFGNILTLFLHALEKSLKDCILCVLFLMLPSLEEDMEYS